MPYPTVEEFGAMLLARPVEQVVQDVIFQGIPFGGVPYVFRTRPSALNRLRQHLSAALNVEQENVIVVGSAKIGFSVSPDTFSRRFSPRSDIDVVVVDASLFDSMWTTVLKWHYVRRGILPRADWDWVRGRMADFYWGWLAPDRIRYDGLSLPEGLKPLRDLSARWFNAFRSLSEYAEFAARNVSGRLYRTWEHALRYHEWGLAQIRASIGGGA